MNVGLRLKTLMMLKKAILLKPMSWKKLNVNDHWRCPNVNVSFMMPIL